MQILLTHRNSLSVLFSESKSNPVDHRQIRSSNGPGRVFERRRSGKSQERGGIGEVSYRKMSQRLDFPMSGDFPQETAASHRRNALAPLAASIALSIPIMNKKSI
jgi:hypothetical protein